MYQRIDIFVAAVPRAHFILNKLVRAGFDICPSHPLDTAFYRPPMVTCGEWFKLSRTDVEYYYFHDSYPDSLVVPVYTHNHLDGYVSLRCNYATFSARVSSDGKRFVMDLPGPAHREVTNLAKVGDEQLRFEHMVSMLPWYVAESYGWYTRPWGRYKILSQDENRRWSKLIHVFPDKQLSLQSHKHRSETWMTVDGSVEVTLADRPDGPHRSYSLLPGETVDIPLGKIHRMAWKSGEHGATVVEVANGDDVREDDIIRYEDDYGRAG